MSREIKARMIDRSRAELEEIEMRLARAREIEGQATVEATIRAQLTGGQIAALEKMKILSAEWTAESAATQVEQLTERKAALVKVLGLLMKAER